MKKEKIREEEKRVKGTPTSPRLDGSAEGKKAEEKTTNSCSDQRYEFKTTTEFNQTDPQITPQLITELQKTRH
ncbi:MAG: hypothetical protein GY737_25760 [Desulfobacteraceae bacterium]|nr:hypothetical protein [Desulfobacteraceae bacterium]